MKQTTLDLNGPILEFSTNPQNVTVNNAGIATFIGIASAYFISQNPTNIFSSNTGIVTHRWYATGIGALLDGNNATLKATLSGTATTTLTISNVTSPTTSGIQLFVSADHIPSAYQSSSPITAGTGRSTGNAINEILFSNTATLTVNPFITINTQPSSSTVAQNRSATFSVTAITSDSSNSNLSYQWYANGSPLSNGANVSGATSSTLTISLPNVSTNTVFVEVSHPTAGNSPVISNSVTYDVVDARQIITFEQYNGSNASITNINLFDGEFTLLPANTATLAGFYASEKDINIEMDIFAAAGRSNGGFSGGEGGFSRVRFTLPQNVEFVIAGLNFGETAFIYRRSTLILICGAGGSAGSSGNGGAGGGVGIRGSDGFGRSGGTGGASISAGELGLNGTHGSSSRQSPRAPFPQGGRALSCPIGEYWRNLGFSACTNVGNVRFFQVDGTQVTNSAIISRGFKAGYGIRQTAGAGDGGATGGTGVTGGNGGTGGSGAGGGSGYQDGSVTVISTQQGGNTGTARIIFRAVL